MLMNPIMLEKKKMQELNHVLYMNMQGFLHPNFIIIMNPNLYKYARYMCNKERKRENLD